MNAPDLYIPSKSFVCICNWTETLYEHFKSWLICWQHHSCICFLLFPLFLYFAFSYGFHHLHSTCWHGPWYSKEVCLTAFNKHYIWSRFTCIRKNLILFLLCCVSLYLIVCVQWQVQPGGAGYVCQHSSSVGHYWGPGHASEFVPSHCTHWPLNLRSHRLQWIQICWVRALLMLLPSVMPSLFWNCLVV